MSEGLGQRDSRVALRRAGRALFPVALLVVFVASVVSVPAGPDFRFSDKVQHGAAFLLLGLLARIGHGELAQADRLMLVLLGYGLLIEGVQALLPWRECSFWDWAADALGVAAASAPWLRLRLADGATR